MQNKIGSLVAIDPQTGEILAIITSPTYDPNLLVGRTRNKNFGLLLKDTMAIHCSIVLPWHHILRAQRLNW
jgi:penicillin-binding protein 2